MQAEFLSYSPVIFNDTLPTKQIVIDMFEAFNIFRISKSNLQLSMKNTESNWKKESDKRLADLIVYKDF